jgi:hypothetical protein
MMNIHRISVESLLIVVFDMIVSLPTTASETADQTEPHILGRLIQTERGGALIERRRRIELFWRKRIVVKIVVDQMRLAMRETTDETTGEMFFPVVVFKPADRTLNSFDFQETRTMELMRTEQNDHIRTVVLEGLQTERTCILDKRKQRIR